MKRESLMKMMSGKYLSGQLSVFSYQWLWIIASRFSAE